MAIIKTKTLSTKKTAKAHDKNKKNSTSQKAKPKKNEKKATKKTVSQEKKQIKTKTKTKTETKTIKPAASKAKKPAPAKPKEPVVTGKKPQDILPDYVSLIKKLLLAKREEIIREAGIEIKKNVKGEPRQIVESALDDGDLSVIDLSQDIALKRLGAHRENLIKIDEALRKIQDGTYGICDECGEQISAGRLKVMPSAIFCRDCQEKKEELEKAGREEEL